MSATCAQRRATWWSLFLGLDGDAECGRPAVLREGMDVGPDLIGLTGMTFCLDCARRRLGSFGVGISVAYERIA